MMRRCRASAGARRAPTWLVVMAEAQGHVRLLAMLLRRRPQVSLWGEGCPLLLRGMLRLQLVAVRRRRMSAE